MKRLNQEALGSAWPICFSVNPSGKRRTVVRGRKLKRCLAAPASLGHRSHMKTWMRLSAASFWPMVLAGCAGHTDQPFNVVVRGPASACTIMVDGRRATLDELRTLARPAAKAGRRVRIDSDMADVPYRCIGGAIYMLQAAGFRDVGFAAHHAGPRL